MVNRNIVGAHYGLFDWLVQRMTAIVMIVVTVALVIGLLAGAGTSYETWRGFMSSGLMRFISFLGILALCWHAWVGVRDIWMDYVQPAGIKLALHALTLLALIGYAGWVVRILWRL